jgi:hypothetical protein
MTDLREAEPDGKRPVTWRTVGTDVEDEQT